MFDDEPIAIAPEMAAFPINLILRLPLHRHITMQYSLINYL
jgi:hypothetical protein